MQENKISQDNTKYFTKEQLQWFLESKFGIGLDFKIRVGPDLNYSSIICLCLIEAERQLPVDFLCPCSNRESKSAVSSMPIPVRLIYGSMRSSEYGNALLNNRW